VLCTDFAGSARWMRTLPHEIAKRKPTENGFVPRMPESAGSDSHQDMAPENRKLCFGLTFGFFPLLMRISSLCRTTAVVQGMWRPRGQGDDLAGRGCVFAAGEGLMMRAAVSTDGSGICSLDAPQLCVSLSLSFSLSLCRSRERNEMTSRATAVLRSSSVPRSVPSAS
jgi:hypothetical protein